MLLPPAYVVRREGNVLTRVCPSIDLSVHRGYPGQVQSGGGGYPGQVQMGGGVPWLGLDEGVPQPGPDGGGGGTLARSTQEGTPARSRWGVPWPGEDGGIP